MSDAPWVERSAHPQPLKRILDLFSGAGGAGVGYRNAGFEVYCVDIEWHENPAGIFAKGDALEFLAKHHGEFDAVHASPPCQRFSSMTKRHGRAVVETWPDLIGPTRDMLNEIGIPYVIENVINAPLIDPVMLCGDMFHLKTTYEGNLYRLRRHRNFETNWGLVAPEHHKHEGLTVGVYGHPGGSSTRDGLRFPQFKNWGEAMGIDWMTVHEMAEAIPPAYTQYVGTQLLNHLNKEAA